ncbi:GrpB family protein [Geodermatophilus sp. SYSU D00815]
MDPERDRHLDAVLIGGREPVTVVVADHDPDRPVRFAGVAAGLRAALGDRALGVEHIGSTSVPGLAAKPVVDVLLAVADVEDEASYAPALEGAGFALRVREPGHRMCRTPARDVHVHVHEPDDAAVADYLDLRDWLRVDEADRLRYEAVKRELARRPWPDMNHYADAKSDVIAEALDRARRWRASGSGHGAT